MISINAIIFSNYMICEVYRSHSWRHGYPPSGLRDPEAVTKTGSHFGDSFFPLLLHPMPHRHDIRWAMVALLVESKSVRIENKYCPSE